MTATQHSANRLRVRNAAFATLGATIEYYDYTIFGFLALTISKVFFSISDPTNALIASLVTFGLASVLRPLGAMIFGRLGDIRGRKFVMVTAIAMMGGASLMIGLAPSYATTGLTGTAILIFGRCLQGISSGAEQGSSIAYLIEWAPPGRRGLYGSLQQVGSAVGLLLGALTAALLTWSLDSQAVVAWGWRLPFLAGFGMAMIGLYLRLKLDESPEFEAIADHVEPLQITRSGIVIPSLQTIGISTLWAVSVFASVIYMPTFMVHTGTLTADRAMGATVLAALAMIATIFLAGGAADRFGSKAVILTAASGYLLCAYPGYALVANGISYAGTVAIVVLFGVLAGIISGVAPVAIAELFAVNIRSTWTSIASAIASSLVGGLAPASVTFLIRYTGIPGAPGFYVMAAALVTGVTALTLPRGGLDRA